MALIKLLVRRSVWKCDHKREGGNEVEDENIFITFWNPFFENKLKLKQVLESHFLVSRTCKTSDEGFCSDIPPLVNIWILTNTAKKCLFCIYKCLDQFFQWNNATWEGFAERQFWHQVTILIGKKITWSLRRMIS